MNELSINPKLTTEMHLKATLCTVLLGVLSFQAQASDFEVAPSKTKISLNKGLVIENDKNKMEIHARIQNRVNLEMAKDLNMNEAEMLIRRMRLQIKGHIGSPKMFYDMQVDFTAYGQDAQANGNINGIRQSIIGYKPNENWKFVFGQQQIQFNREFMMSSSNIAFVDRSQVNEIFGISRDFGAFATYQSVFGEKFAWELNASITSGEGINFDTFTNSGLAYTLAAELYPSGRFSTKPLPISGSLMNENIIQTYIGGGFSYNDRTMRLDGQDGNQENLILGGQRRSLRSYFFDFTARYRRWTLDTSVMGRKSHDPLVYQGNDPEQFSYAGDGMNYQLSYYSPKNWEFGVRNTTIFPDHEIQLQLGYSSWNVSGLAVSKYFLNYAVKVQADLEYNYQKGLADQGNVAYSPYLVSFQCEVLF